MRMTPPPVSCPGLARPAAARPRHPRPGRCVARLLFVVAAVAGLGWAVAGVAAAEPVPVLAVAGSIGEVLDNLRNWLIGILAAIATVCLTVAGVRYLVCAGDPSEVERAKTALKGAAIGYALAMLAPVVVEVLKSIVGG